MNILTPCIEAIPLEMRAFNQWVCWRLEPKPEKPDDLTKIPYTARNGDKAKAGQPETWDSFPEVVDTYEASQAWAKPYSGIGFELHSTDPFFAGDLDKCIHLETGEIEPWALDIVQEVSPYAYVERSPSGTGLRFIGRGSLPPGGRKSGKVEMYDALRYITITGRPFGAAVQAISDCSRFLPTLHTRLFPPKTTQEPPTKMGPQRVLSLSDQQILDIAGKAVNSAKFDALWRGDTGSYSSSSEADLALCSLLAFYCGADPRRIDHLFRSSGLYREKWDTRHHGDGRTYGEGTVQEALAGKTEFYSPPGIEIIRRGQKSAGAVSAGNAVEVFPRGGEGEVPSQDDSKPSTQNFALTDIGNGQRLAVRHGNDLRYCYAWDKWLIWDGQRWQKDDTGEIARRAKETAQHIYQEAADCTDTAQQSETAKHALRSQSHARVQSMIALATSEPGVPTRVSEWDKKPWLLAANNGTVDLKTGELHNSQRHDLGTKRAATHYDPDAKAPRWEAFLETVLPDAEVRAFFQRAAGYALTGDVSEQCLFFLYGSGSNGKSTALRALMDTMGDYALQAAPDLLIAREAAGGPNNDVAELQGTRLVATIEVEDGKRMAEGLVKQITGGDRIKARYMRQDFFEFEPTHKIFLAANHKPTIRGQDFAIWRRIKVIPFEVQIGDAQKDPHLPEKLRCEMPGILAWAVRGCLEWQKQGLAVPVAVKAATDAYQGEQDALADFLNDCCLIRPSLKVTTSALFLAYIKWAKENSERELSKKNFGTRLQEGRQIFPVTNVVPRTRAGGRGSG